MSRRPAPMPDLVRAKAIVNRAIHNAVENGYLLQKPDRDRIMYLRPSQLPYCALHEFFELPKLFTKSSSHSFSRSFYTHIGSAVHTVLQRALQSVSSKESYALNDWVCQNRKCQHRHPLKRLIKTCRKCGGTDVRPDEHEINLPWLRGHIDTILIYGRYAVIVDYKTTSSKGVASKSGAEKGYRYQIGTYCTLMEPVLAEMGFTLLGWSLVYVARDNFVRKVVVGDDYVPMKQLRAWSKEHQSLLTLSTEADLKVMVDNRVCQTKEQNAELHPWCPYRNYCLAGSKPTMKAAKIVLAKLEGKLPLKPSK